MHSTQLSFYYYQNKNKSKLHLDPLFIGKHETQALSEALPLCPRVVLFVADF